MSAPSDEDGWMREYDDASGASHHNDLLTQQQQEERKKMAWEPKDNKIGIFKNKYKKTESEPALKGDGLIGGKHWEVAGWVNIDKNGNKYIALNFQPPRDKAEGYNKPAPSHDEDFDF